MSEALWTADSKRRTRKPTGQYSSNKFSSCESSASRVGRAGEAAETKGGSSAAVRLSVLTGMAPVSGSGHGSGLSTEFGPWKADQIVRARDEVDVNDSLGPRSRLALGGGTNQCSNMRLRLVARKNKEGGMAQIAIVNRMVQEDCGKEGKRERR
ncbi:hypothetical protein BT67DRAFT_440871 [Trichocladium antarcticum]|uniref:Uncharacterized protein n=1 Tax=Trichocladium antarcticum TaxID=1450529 RepID=A0AAN6ULE1_9PEZI|nr:hypothetical protein BT67DRAFT_440871 [Trichocladium antarcticum]